MNNSIEIAASDCIERMRSCLVASEFGYKIQALAAHVLLRLGYRIVAVNQSGHPDIIATWEGREFRFEVESEVSGPRLHQLEGPDFASLTETPYIIGYYALAISFPSPYWVLVPVSELIDRKHPSSNILLEALSDKKYSAEWTRAYKRILRDECRQIRQAPFSDLSRWAVEGRGL